MTNVIRTTGQLGPVIKQLRKAKGWSQAELGKKIGLSQERISKIEGKPESCSINQLLTILMALNAELHIEQRNSLSGNVTIGSAATGQFTTKPRESW
jgi:HTH-type transcriptional regulator/antitoxin HipB